MEGEGDFGATFGIKTGQFTDYHFLGGVRTQSDKNHFF